MSVDPLGRVIVGSGHFIERIPGIVNTATQVVVRGGHFQQISNAFQAGQNAARNFDNFMNWTRLVVDDTIPETAREAYQREVAERLATLGSAGGDIVQAYGWAAAGDLQSAWEKLVDAAVKSGEVFLDGIANPPPTHN